MLSTQDAQVNHRPALGSPQARIGQEVEVSPKRLAGPGSGGLEGMSGLSLGRN